ncbi:hypothetical protein GGI00_000199 [Coemansia sp. RSA 2681]|nr:hypothetical protein GGI00_000199 [Coemansia sp. RSA 2681]
MRFTPTVPVRRNKTELSALMSAGDKKPSGEVKRERDSRFERGRGRGMRGGGRGGHHEVVQVVAGPFAQGPASLGNNAARRNMGSVFLGSGVGGSGGGGGGGGSGGNGIAGSGGRATKPGTSLPGISGNGGGGYVDGMDVDGQYGDESNAPMLMLTDHNEALAIDEFAVQTEEMAIAAAEAMSRLNLDTTMAELFARSSASTSAADGDDGDERLIVFQLPGVPEFELSKETIASTEEEEPPKSDDNNPSASSDSGDVKPNIADLDAAADLMAMAVDVKPDLTALSIDDDDDNKEKVEKTGEEEEEEEDGEEGLVEGRIGTLVVLKSGAVKMKIGDILMDVSRGADCQFFRGLMALDDGAQGENNYTAFLLGNVDAVAMCTPDLENIL